MILVKAIEDFGLLKAGETGIIMYKDIAEKAQKEGKIEIIANKISPKPMSEIIEKEEAKANAKKK
jgi:hypothetical protein